MGKTIIENRAVLDVVNPETGEILEHQESTGVKTIHSAEPPYIKLYIEDIMYISDLPKAFSNLTYSLLKRTNYANDEEGLCVNLSQFVKEKILVECGWTEMRSLNNALVKLCKGNILKRLGTGTYQFNPYLFGKGEWKDIDNIRVEWNYDEIKGRTFQSTITRKSNVESVEESNEQGEIVSDTSRLAV